MPVAVWSDSLATGNPVVDEQHKQLFNMVNKLNEAILAGHAKELILKVLDGLARYVVVHFQAEEKLMQEKGYPQFTAHKKIHDDLTTQAVNIIEDYRSGKITLTLQLSQFLGDWIRTHILQEDQKMIQWVRSQG